MRRRFLNPDFNITINPSANNLILYTTVDNASLGMEVGTMFGEAKLVQELYSNGLGVILFSEDVKVIALEAFKSKSNLKTIILPKSVEEIDVDAFYDCRNLTSIIIEEGITSIGGGAFLKCINLQSISVPESVIYMGASAFEECHSLTNFTFPSEVALLGDGCFKDCTSLRKVTLSRQCSLPNNVFRNCNNLKTLVIYDITSMLNSSFYGCSSLQEFEYKGDSISRNVFKDAIIDENRTSVISKITKVVIGNRIKTIGYANMNLDYAPFCNFTSLKTVKFEGDALTYLCESAFEGCSKLESVDLSKQTRLTALNKFTFMRCSSLTTVLLPPKIKKIPLLCFDGCYNLSNIVLHEGITHIEHGAFRGCAIKKFKIPKSLVKTESYSFANTNIGIVDIYDIKAYLNLDFHATDGHPACANGAVFTINEKAITSFDVTGLSKVPPHAFHWKEGLPCTLTKITGNWNSGAIIGDYAFANCNNLYINNDSSKVSEIRDYAFYNCKNLVWKSAKDRDGSLLDSGSANGLFMMAGVAAGMIVAGAIVGGPPGGIIAAAGAVGYIGGMFVYDATIDKEELEATHQNTVINVDYIGKHAFENSSIKHCGLGLGNVGVLVRSLRIDDYAFYNCDTDAIKYTKRKGENSKDFYIGYKAFMILPGVRNAWIFSCAFNELPESFNVDTTICLSNLITVITPYITDFPEKEIKETHSNIEFLHIDFVTES